MRRRYLGFGALALALLTLAPVHAQAPGELDVPKDARWTHASSAIALDPVLAGLQLYKVTSTAPMELDVQAQYEAPDHSTFATVFIFRPGAGDLAVWFDRATATIAASDRWSIASTLESGPFTPPGSDRASALKAVYALDGQRYRSTAVALLSVQGWVAKIRITSATLDAAALEALINTVIGQIGWPEGLAHAPAAVPVADCAKPIGFGKMARPARRSKDNALANAMVSALMNNPELDREDDTTSKAIIYCRDAVLGPHGIYRAMEQTDGYLLALGDAGRAAAVQPAMGLFDAGSAKSFSVSFFGLDRTLHFLDQDRLVPPAQLIDIIQTQRAVSSVATTEGGSTITLDPGGAKR